MELIVALVVVGILRLFKRVVFPLIVQAVEEITEDFVEDRRE
jgi:hypothetical protein